MYYNKQVDEVDARCNTGSPKMESKQFKKERSLRISAQNLPTFEFDFRGDLTPTDDPKMKKYERVRIPDPSVISRKSNPDISVAGSPIKMGDKFKMLDRLDNVTKFFVMTPY